MTIDDVKKELYSGKYDEVTSFPDLKDKDYYKKLEAYRKDGKEKNFLFKEDLIQCFKDAGVGQEAANKCADLAWAEGHNNGRTGVLIIAEDYMNIALSIIKETLTTKKAEDCDDCACTEEEECDCMCHKSKDILHFHISKCCNECSKCGKNIKLDKE